MVQRITGSTDVFSYSPNELVSPVYQTGQNISRPGQYFLQSITLFLNDGSKYDLTPFMMELTIFEDIFAPAMSGRIMIDDARGFIENFNISGFNFIQLNFSKTGDGDPLKFSKTFRVYKIGERYQQSRSHEVYPIFFCSEERLISEQMRIAKSYPNMMIHEIINSILNNYLKVPSSKLQGVIEETKGYYDFIIPNLKPFEALNWLSTYAQPKEDYFGADMLFFENRYGFNFRSLQSMFTDKPYKTYNYSPQNVNTESLNFEINSIISYNFIQTFNSLQTIRDGGFANKLLSIDPLLRNTKVTEFKYDDYFNKGVTLNQYPVSIEQQNRLNKTVTQSTDAVFKVLAGNSGQRRSDTITSNFDNLGSTVPDIGVEVYVPNRTAQLSLINHAKIEVTVPGDPGLSVGRIVTLCIPSLSYNDSKDQANLDQYYNGRYLITAVKHVLDIKGRYHCIFEASSDSVSTSYIAPSNGNDWQNMVNS